MNMTFNTQDREITVANYNRENDRSIRPSSHYIVKLNILYQIRVQMSLHA